MMKVAREFRKETTKSEAILWQALRGKKLDGIKFRRQQPMRPLIVDFYNSVYRIIEINNEWPHWLLATKLDPIQFFSAQSLPKYCFTLGCFFSKFTSNLHHLSTKLKIILQAWIFFS